jgi:glycogen operon protein
MGKGRGHYQAISFWLILWGFCVAPGHTHATDAGRSCEENLALLGAHYNPSTGRLGVNLISHSANKVRLEIFKNPFGEKASHSLELERDPHTPSLWNAEVDSETLTKLGFLEGEDKSRLHQPFYYGFRLWGPNWEFHPEWKPGSELGFVNDVDENGHRFNPNKLIFDPYARELSHDPLNLKHGDPHPYLSGWEFRNIDSAPIAPKGIAFTPPNVEKVPGPDSPLSEDIVYEVHVRGFTKNDPSIPEEERGTYKGFAKKAAYLKELGVTAVELLPIHEFQNDRNQEHTTEGNNYWGYMTLNYFSPERRYATATAQKEPGGVTREFTEMINELHRHGIKVILDVVYNHTGEDGVGGQNAEYGKLLSFRGIDNPTYYQLAQDKRWYKDNTGCGANFNCANPTARNLIMDSLKYYRDLGVDGFRFDLASVLGNVVAEGNTFHFDKMAAEGVLNRALRELPSRNYQGGKGIDLIAEPWAVGDYSYQLGNFPSHAENNTGWHEWNGQYRDKIRLSQNSMGFKNPTPGDLAHVISGSYDLFGSNGRKPGHSVNFVVAHDGFTLNDLYTYNDKQNQQKGIFGPSDGGEDHNNSWNQGWEGTPEEQQSRRRQAARNGFALPLLSFGVPMFNSGDEFLRTQKGNNNMWNVDSPGSWVNWEEQTRNSSFYDFAKKAIAFRKSQAGLSRAEYAPGEIHWYQANGQSAENAEYMNDGHKGFLGWRVGVKEGDSAKEGAIYVAYNFHPDRTQLHLPPASPGKKWYWVLDTSSRFEAQGNVASSGHEKSADEMTMGGSQPYLMDGRTTAVFIEK